MSALEIMRRPTGVMESTTIEVKMFKFELGQEVEIGISGEQGYIKGRAEYTEDADQYYVHYKAGDGRACFSWLSGTELKAA